jgi:hypothetical protein
MIVGLCSILFIRRSWDTGCTLFYCFFVFVLSFLDMGFVQRYEICKVIPAQNGTGERDCIYDEMCFFFDIYFVLVHMTAMRQSI